MQHAMRKNDYLLPAEWHTQSGIQLTWPHAETDWRDMLAEITDVFLAMADVITRHELLLVVTPQPVDTRIALQRVLDDKQMEHVIVCEIPTNDTWARDHAALTLVPTDATGDIPARLLDFGFNGWGEKFAAQHDNAITARLCAAGVLHGEREDNLDFVLEGGSIESDGEGTVFTTSTCLLAPHRNQPLTQADIESRLKTTLHAERIVWLDHGTLLGDDTDGHIDTIVRCAPDDALLYVSCQDPDDVHYEDFLKLQKQLQELRTLQDTPYRLMPLPMPKAIYCDGNRLPATYANFIVLNGAVICPTYRQPDLDALAIDVLRQAFPDREVIGIDACPVIRQHGSLHCLTMQYPKGVITSESTHAKYPNPS